MAVAANAFGGLVRRHVGILALAVLVAGTALLLQPFGFVQGAHYSLVKALASGTPRIDAFQAYSGDESFFHGHYYSNKAPGVAFLLVPFYVVLHGLGLPSGVHVLTLIAAVAPAFVLLLLVRRVAEDWAPGYGTATALTLGAGTLLLPLSSLLFSHVLSATLGFAAFALLWRERAGTPRFALVAAAGLLAGLAVTTEYPLAVVGFVLGFYAIARTPIVQRGLAYTAGVLAGVAPLLLYNKWAFGSFTHISYSQLVVVRGVSGHDQVSNRPGFHGVTFPDPHMVVELLFSPRGLLRLSPVLVLGLVGTVLLFRSGRRAEALVIVGVSLLIMGYDAGFEEPFGGWGPGTRYLTAMVPFLAAPIGLAYRRAPLTTAALALCSIGFAVASTATEPLLPNNYFSVWRRTDLADTGHWFHRFGSGDFTRSVLSSAGLGHGWIAIAPFLLAVAAAVILAAVATWPVVLARRDAESALVVVAGWLLAAIAGPLLLHHDRVAGGPYGALAVLALAFGVAAAALFVRRSGLGAALPALALFAFAVHPFAHHTGWALGVAVVVLAAQAAAAARLNSAFRSGEGGIRTLEGG